MNDKVTVYKMTIQLIDFEGRNNLDDIIESIENNKYYNVRVRSSEKKTIVWTDQHPLNMNNTAEQTFLDLFS